MSQVITTNVASLNAQRNLNSSQASLQTSLQRLSSGLRINSAKDDAAGLAISDRMTSQISGMNQAARNANDGISMTQTVEGNLAQISANLQRMRDLSVQSSNDTNTQVDRDSLQLEMSQLATEINRIAKSAQFNGKNLLDGSFGSATFQVGSNAGQTISMSITSATTTSLGLGLALAEGAVSSTTAIDNGDGTTDAGSMSINGVIVGTSHSDGVSYADGVKDDAAGLSSALSLTTAINLNTAFTGVTASAKTTVTSTTGTDQSALSTGLMINGQLISDATGTASLVANINLKTFDTGVTAEIVATDPTTYRLIAADGRNIDIVAGDNSGLIDATTYGQVSLTSGRDFTIEGTAVGGLAEGSYIASASAGPKIDSQYSAGLAISNIDIAITMVNSQRSIMGSMQTRFDSVVANLQSSAENLSAARSRIRDTDFAAETANLTRNQILQQAGTAMLAQANALPSNVLALLK